MVDTLNPLSGSLLLTALGHPKLAVTVPTCGKGFPAISCLSFSANARAAAPSV
ncbi:MAG: hypothetical protein ACK55E_03795 [Cyanobacteriota bacterium]|jgi:hypothetical protein